MIKLDNEEKTKQLATDFAKRLKPGDLVVLNGDLGAGKTTFTRYTFEALGAKGVVNSPTFAIMKVYESPVAELYHFDTYRIDVNEAIESGFDEILSNRQGKIIFIEWSENIAPLLQNITYTINLKYLTENEREIEIVNNEQTNN
ncbi:MAG: tRNA (adenosine(37)-N6)-threonylcarbamoyltransferase complex ATPase subunit type 1 TsaE [Clostridia bacterium]|nr:tRNA (adenosine(37)-N6)-threonylcarbamoyltransferase complex ATPase subunit type 1 TsaE [Clostridia bacterium]